LSGLYESDIKLNFYKEDSNKWYENLVTSNANVPDNNMFVTNFILNAIMDCYEYGTLDDVII